MLALATLDPEAWAPARTWILVFVVARSAFAAWVGRHPGRLLDGQGRRPARLGLAVAAPRGRVRDGRRRRRSGSRGSSSSRRGSRSSTWPSRRRWPALILLATLAPLAYYGRLLAIGLARPDRVGEPRGTWRPRLTRPDVTVDPASGRARPGTPTGRSRRRPSRSCLPSSRSRRRPGRSAGRRPRPGCRRAWAVRASSSRRSPRATCRCRSSRSSRTPAGTPPSVVRGEHPASTSRS